MWFFSMLKELFTPWVQEVVFSYPEHSELSNPKAKRIRSESSIGTTKRILEDNIEARDDKELFIQIISCHTSSFADLEKFSRSWRYVQQHFPELRGKNWQDRQRKANLIRKTF